MRLARSGLFRHELKGSRNTSCASLRGQKAQLVLRDPLRPIPPDFARFSLSAAFAWAEAVAGAVEVRKACAISG